MENGSDFSRAAPWLCAIVNGTCGPFAAAFFVAFRLTLRVYFLIPVVTSLVLILLAFVWKERVTEGKEISAAARAFSLFFPLVTSVPGALFVFAMIVRGG